MKPIHNSQVAEIFEEIGDMLDIQGENRFRVLAYRNAAEVISNLTEEVQQMIVEGKDLTELPGIGKDLAGKIEEIVKKGGSTLYKELQKKTPLSLVRLIHLQDLGPKKVAKLNKKLGIKDIDDLEKAAKAGKIAKLEGFGQKSQEKILDAISHFKGAAGRMRFAEAVPIVNSLVPYLEKLKGVKQVEVAGSFRRRKETVGDLDILVTGDTSSPVLNGFKKYTEIKSVLASGETKVTVRLLSGIQVDVRFLEPKSFGAALCYFTGSKEHNVALRNIAKKKAMKLSEYGLFKGKAMVAGKTEEEIYKKLGLEFIPPELREMRGEIEASQNKELPTLISLQDIRGDLHMHTSATDGANTIEDMAHAAKKLGLEYIAITDHSQGQRQAGGLDPKAMRKHLENIRKADASISGIKIFCGSEVDILKDGSLDYKDDLLDEMDVVVASLHSHFTLSRAEQTKRVVKAIKSGKVTIIGHLTTRLIGTRKPVDIDVEEVLKAAKDYNVVMESSAQPSRLDLNDIYCKMAKEMGVKIAINTDAHSVQNLALMRFGVDNVRRGWIEKSDVFNCLPLIKLQKHLR
ncbi:MAG TPA: DNA polymerase/3'-5' exonuclease PolX [Bdellovibrionota bacterium]|nr:DNA polymerase/3'-5' exonuclease PolX [Bdellovibrionota bacterium]